MTLETFTVKDIIFGALEATAKKQEEMKRCQHGERGRKKERKKEEASEW